MSVEPGEEEAFVRRLRRFLLALWLFSAVGILVELLLLGHHDQWRQKVPIALLALAVLVGTTNWFRPRGGRLLLLRAVALGLVVAGVVGVYLHLAGNAEFEREMVPTIGGLALLTEAFRGATPALAPGSLVQIGAVGWLYTLKHPGWRAQ